MRVCACVCAFRARVRTIRAGARARRTRALHAHCACAPYARSAREPNARTVRKKCAPKSAVVFPTKYAAFFENLLRFFKICCDFEHARSTRIVAVRYGARARTVRTRVCTCKLRARARAHANRTRGARAHCTYAPCARTARTVREPYARTVRKKCALKSAVFYSKSAVVFKICCVFLKICCVFLYVRPARTVAVRHGARTYVRATRARCTYRTRTVPADCTQNACAKFC